MVGASAQTVCDWTITLVQSGGQGAWTPFFGGTTVPQRALVGLWFLGHPCSMFSPGCCLPALHLPRHQGVRVRTGAGKGM
jgi:hypothetical protein